MSWSASYTWNGNKQTEISVPRNLSTEAQAQADTAFDASAAIILTGAVGAKDKTYKVALSGHANPGHEPTAGWSNDCITIYISQVGEPSEEG